MEVGQGLFGGYEAQIGNFLRVSATGEIGPGWSAQKRLTHKQGNNNKSHYILTLLRLQIGRHKEP